MTLDNTAARRLFLAHHGLAEPTAGPGRGDDLHTLIHALGFVQLDSIKTVERAHHMILHARRPSYRPKNLHPLLERDRRLFEHWTHDAAIIPVEFFPYWRQRFETSGQQILQRWKKHRPGIEIRVAPVLQQIQRVGPVCSSDVGDGEARGSGAWWDWHPSKSALHYLWHSGQISVTRRQSFRKFYDLTERVIPADLRARHIDETQITDWACTQALTRLGFATAGELAAFWALITPAQARTWCEIALNSGEIVEIDVVGADGSPKTAFAHPDISQSARDAPPPPGQVRILSPFDPALRDRKRALRLFGFDFRIEVFVPRAKRKYGYYVFPVLEGARLIGRIDMKCHRKDDVLRVTAFWPESDVKIGKARRARLESAIARTARFSGVSEVQFENGWLRD
ncbi:MAG: winged helix-turn-helix domain-containing protein [Paracoccaceae bacterium]